MVGNIATESMLIRIFSTVIMVYNSYSPIVTVLTFYQYITPTRVIHYQASFSMLHGISPRRLSPSRHPSETYFPGGD